MQQLETKLSATPKADKARIAKLKGMIKEQQERLAKEEMAPAAPPPPPPAAPAPAPAPSAPSKGGLDIGGKVGMFAGATGAEAELGFPVDFLTALGMGTVNGKVGLGYAQGTGTSHTTVKIIPIFVDGILMLPPDLIPGAETYVGAGLNYVVYRSGAKTGTIGGEVLVGIQGDPFGIGGKTYLELGYGMLRSGTVTPGTFSLKGVTATIGWKMPLVF